MTVGGRGLTAVGVVMGQGQGSDTSVLLAAAGEAAKQLVQSVAPATRVRTIPRPAGPARLARAPADTALRLARSRSRLGAELMSTQSLSTGEQHE